MNIHQILMDSNPLLSLGAVAAGFGDVQTGAEVPMSPQYDAVLFIAVLGAITATGQATLRARGTNVSGTYGANTIGCFVDPTSGLIAQANAFTGDSNTLLALDIYRPLTAFVRPEIQRQTANIVIQSMIALQYNSKVGSPIYTGLATHYTTPGYGITSNPSLSAV